MGRQTFWQYAVIWDCDGVNPKYRLFRLSNIGHRFLWAEVEAPGRVADLSTDQVLEELYRGVLALMEATVE